MTTTLLSTSSDLDRSRLVTVFRRAAGFVPSGVAILRTPEIAMTVSSVQCVSFDPPLVTVALSKDSHKARSILANGQFCVRLLRTGEEKLAKGEGVPCGGGMVEMECEIVACHSVGDHDLVVAGVGTVRMSECSYPLVYWRRGIHGLQPRYDFVASREAFQRFLDEWEAGTLPKASWTHAAHVAIGAYYAVLYPGEGFERTKTGITRYNEAAGTENSGAAGYHDTLTRLWANVLAKFVNGFTDPWKAACEAVIKFGEDRDLHHLYYSFDVIRSKEARRSWIPPDLEGPY